MKVEPDPLQKNNIILDIALEDATWCTLPFDYQLYTEDIVDAVFKSLNLCKAGDPVEVSLLLSNNQRLQSLNLNFREKNEPTNVLSFAYEELNKEQLLKLFPHKKPLYLGDIALSYETISKEANEQNKSFKDHFTHLIIHGILHLLGWDHIQKDEQIEMEALETKILKQFFNINNPYQL